MVRSNRIGSLEGGEDPQHCWNPKDPETVLPGVKMSGAILADGRQLDARMHVTLFNGRVVHAPTERIQRYATEALLQLLSSEPITNRWRADADF